MTIQQAVMTYARDNLANNNLHYATAPKTVEPPYIVMMTVSAPREDTHEGPDGLVEVRLQFDWYAKTYQAVLSDFTAARLLFAGYQGLMGNESDNVWVAGCEIADEGDGYESDVKLYRKTMDLLIKYEE